MASYMARQARIAEHDDVLWLIVRSVAAEPFRLGMPSSTP